MEKKRPTHDLAAFQRAFALHRNVSLTALRSAQSIGYDREEVAHVVATMQRRDFVKSVTSFGDHRRWHDVYHVAQGSAVLYLKFTDDTLTGFILLSFKPRDP